MKPLTELIKISNMNAGQKLLVAVAVLCMVSFLFYPPGRDVYSVRVSDYTYLQNQYLPIPNYATRRTNIRHKWLFDHDEIVWWWLLFEWTVVAGLCVGGLYLMDSAKRE